MEVVWLSLPSEGLGVIWPEQFLLKDFYFVFLSSEWLETVTLDKSGITTDMTEVHSVMVNFINNALAISTTTKSGDVW